MPEAVPAGLAFEVCFMHTFLCDAVHSVVQYHLI